MHEDVLKKLEQRVDRRSFLRGSGLAAAAIVGAAAFPLAAHAQDRAPQAPKDEKKDDKKEEKKEDKKDEKAETKDDKGSKKEEAKDAKAEVDPFKETKKDEQGRDYRMCPQCGYNMYKQDRTWTCENCGYSYAE